MSWNGLALPPHASFAVPLSLFLTLGSSSVFFFLVEVASLLLNLRCCRVNPAAAFLVTRFS
jgi:hypothetical protein